MRMDTEPSKGPSGKARSTSGVSLTDGSCRELSRSPLSFIRMWGVNVIEAGEALE